MYILNIEAINKLSAHLGIQISDGFQDWEIEYASSGRVEEFVEYYSQNNLNEDEKRALFALILSSADNALNKGDHLEMVLEKITAILKSDFQCLTEIVGYWLSEKDGESFKIGKKLA